MPQLVFDPEGEFEKCSIQKRNKLYGGGGGLTGAKRCEYVALCKQMTSRDPALDYAAIRDRILEIMKENVLEYIQTLPEADRVALVADVESFFSTVDKEDNPLTAVNVVGFQISILFTKYLDPRKNGNETVYFDDPQEAHLEYIYTDILKNDEWKVYTNMKSNIEEMYNGPPDIYLKNALVHNKNPTEDIPTETPIFMVFIGFITLGEVIESYFNNIFYLGLMYTRDYIDGYLYNPLEALDHDVQHYDRFTDCLDYPISFSKLREFHAFVMATEDKPVQYAVNFILFFYIHEHYCNNFKTIGKRLLLERKLISNGNRNFNKQNELSKSLNNELFKYITKDDVIEPVTFWGEDLFSTNHFGLAIPKAYRVSKNNTPTKLEEDKVLEYIELAASQFDECYKKFIASQQPPTETPTKPATEPPKEGGKRKRQTRKRRINRKQKYSRRKSSK